MFFFYKKNLLTQICFNISKIRISASFNQENITFKQSIYSHFIDLDYIDPYIGFRILFKIRVYWLSSQFILNQSAVKSVF